MLDFCARKWCLTQAATLLECKYFFVQENGAQCNSWICNLLYLNHYLSGNIIFVQLYVEFKHYHWKLTARVKNGTERMFSCVARQFCDGQYLQFGALTGGFSPRDICICVCVCICIYLCICICVWIWICIYIRICLLFKLMDSTVWGLTGGFPGVAPPEQWPLHLLLLLLLLLILLLLLHLSSPCSVLRRLSSRQDLRLSSSSLWILEQDKKIPSSSICSQETQDLPPGLTPRCALASHPQ